MGTNKGRRWAVPAFLLVAAIAVNGCGGGSDTGPDVDAAAPEKNTVVVRDISFKPDELEVEAGDTVTWRFEDKGIPHDVTGEDGSFKSDTMDSGTFEHTFDEPGTYAYICSLHPAQMKATIEAR